MYEYTNEDRAEVQERINDERYQNKPCDMSMAYQLYDLLRIAVEGISEISERLDALEKR